MKFIKSFNEAFQRQFGLEADHSVTDAPYRETSGQSVSRGSSMPYPANSPQGRSVPYRGQQLVKPNISMPALSGATSNRSLLLYICLDESESMTYLANDVESGAQDMVQFLGTQKLPNLRLSIGSFNSQARTLVDFQNLGGPLPPIHLRCRAGTNHFAAVNHAADELLAEASIQRQNRMVVTPVALLMTDGHHTDRHPLEAANRMKNAGIQLVTLAFGDANHDLLRQMASPGLAFVANDTAALHRFFATFAKSVSVAAARGGLLTMPSGAGYV